jgi:hypothetical protein
MGEPWAFVARRFGIPLTTGATLMNLEQLETEIRHLATKEELQKLRVELILWIIGTQVFATGVVLGAMSFFFQHYKP